MSKSLIFILIKKIIGDIAIMPAKAVLSFGNMMINYDYIYNINFQEISKTLNFIKTFN